MTIYKYPLPELLPGTIVFEMPQGARILKISIQRVTRYIEYADITMAWALVDPDEPLALISLDVFGTGRNIPDDYLDSNQCFYDTVFDGEYVWHIFGPKENWIGS